VGDGGAVSFQLEAGEPSIDFDAWRRSPPCLDLLCRKQAREYSDRIQLDRDETASPHCAKFCGRFASRSWFLVIEAGRRGISKSSS
jgi:hypothetical protein